MSRRLSPAIVEVIQQWKEIRKKKEKRKKEEKYLKKLHKLPKLAPIVLRKAVDVQISNFPSKLTAKFVLANC